jgi:hypothetical protein
VTKNHCKWIEIGIKIETNRQVYRNKFDNMWIERAENKRCKTNFYLIGEEGKKNSESWWVIWEMLWFKNAWCG